MPLLNDLGNKVFGENFVGRKNLVRQLQRECTSQNFSIVGLPKIGKTSLVYHSIIHNRQSVSKKDDHEFIPVFINCSPASTVSEFFDSIIVGIYNAFRMEHTMNICGDIVKNYTEYQGNVKNNISESVLFFLDSLERLQIDIVLILDEFDRVRDIPGFDGSRFGLLTTIVEKDFIHVITVSKRSLLVIEGWNNNPSEFHTRFLKKIVGNFNQTEWDEYWNKVSLDDFGEHRIDDMAGLKEKAFHYSGYNPYWTARFAKCYYDLMLGGDLFDEEKIMNQMIDQCYQPMMDFLHDDRNYRNDIFNTAVQAILGPIYNISIRNINFLKEYGFLAEVALDEKLNLFNGNEKNGVFFTEDGISKSYIAICNHFTSYMSEQLNQYVSPYWSEWDDFFTAWDQLRDDLFPFSNEFNVSELSLPQRIREKWDEQFSLVFDNKGFEWFSLRYNYVVAYKCLEEKNLPIPNEIIVRRNRYLKHLTECINRALADHLANI